MTSRIRRNLQNYAKLKDLVLFCQITSYQYTIYQCKYMSTTMCFMCVSAGSLLASKLSILYSTVMTA